MAWPSRPRWPSAQGISARVFSRLQLSCHTIVSKICSFLIGFLAPGVPRLSQGMLTRSVRAVRVLLTIIEAYSRNGKAKFSAQDTWTAEGQGLGQSLATLSIQICILNLNPGMCLPWSSTCLLCSGFPGPSDLAWPGSAREPPTKSVSMPSTSNRGGIGQPQPEQMTKDEKQQPP